jgi:hypothetical protein
MQSMNAVPWNDHENGSANGPGTEQKLISAFGAIWRKKLAWAMCEALGLHWRILAGLLVLLAVLAGGTAAHAGSLPTDAQNACPLSASTFDGWFQSGGVTLNGVVKPANSLDNLNTSIPCDFYQWGQQMFLWLTSPAPAEYGGGGGRIFDSPAFYDVSPLDGSTRTLLPHTPGVIRVFPLRAAQVGLHGLPVIVDTSNQLLEVKPIDPKLTPQVRDATGKVVTIGHARLVAGKPVLLDAKRIQINAAHIQAAVPRFMLRSEINPLIVQEFNIDGINIFIDPTLAVIDTEQGQAGDGSVLEAQTAANGSLVYYSTMVNDVYAYFLTGVSHGAITTVTPNEFPTTQTDLTNTLNYAAAHGKPASSFPDPDALTIEIKTAWVLASGLPNVSSYVTEEATVPTYKHVSGSLWTPDGQKTVTLALVGVHVVGSTLGHPEMVWASFEHQNNTPLAKYSYTSTSSTTKTVTQPTTGPWVFSANGSGLTFNTAHMSVSNTPVANSIQAATGFTISPSNTSRLQPFGTAGTDIASNTQILSANHNVLSQLASGDIRGNYFLIGATWMPFGSNPVGGLPGVGTVPLANSTLETYQQGASNCFSCHQNTSSATVPTTQISHVFGVTKPLF